MKGTLRYVLKYAIYAVTILSIVSSLATLTEFGLGQLSRRYGYCQKSIFSDEDRPHSNDKIIMICYASQDFFTRLTLFPYANVYGGFV